MQNLDRVFVALLLVYAASASPDPNLLISNGEEASAGQFPYQASIVHRRPFIPDQLLGGGSILNERWILTSGSVGLAALKPLVGSIKVKVGQQRQWGNGEFVQERDVAFAIVHKDRDAGLPILIQNNDIAVIKLSSPLKLNERVQPIDLPKPNSRPKGEAVVSGFGLKSIVAIPPKNLQYANVSIIRQDICKDAIRTVSIANKDRLTDNQICTGPLDKRITACLGDSGNPLVQRIRKGDRIELVQIGITSWGPIICGQRGAPTVYTNVSEYVPWIIKRIEENEI